MKLLQVLPSVYNMEFIFGISFIRRSKGSSAKFSFLSCNGSELQKHSLQILRHTCVKISENCMDMFGSQVLGHVLPPVQQEKPFK